MLPRVRSRSKKKTSLPDDVTHSVTQARGKGNVRAQKRREGKGPPSKYQCPHPEQREQSPPQLHPPFLRSRTIFHTAAATASSTTPPTIKVAIFTQLLS